MKEFFLRASSPLKKITDSIFCTVAINVFVILCWLLNLPILGATVFLIYFVLILLTQKNTNAILPFLASITFIFGRGNETHSLPILPDFVGTLYIVIGCFAPILVASLVWFLVRNKVPLNAGKFSHGVIIFFVVALFGGLGTEYFTLPHILTLLIWFFSLYLLYLFFYNTLDFKIEGCKKYFALSFFIAGLTVVVELFLAYLFSGDFFGHFSISPAVGWGKGPDVAQMLTMNLPFAFYLLSKSKTKKGVILYNVAIVVLLLAIFLTRSRAGMLAVAVAILPLYVLTHKQLEQNQKKTNLITLAIFVGVGLVIAAIFHTQVFALIKKVLRDFTLTGRDFLWNEGWTAFKESPIFGKSFFFEGDFDFGTVDGFIFMYWFHNTAVQVIANLGIVGVFAFGYLYFKKYQVFFSRKNGIKLRGGRTGENEDSINIFILLSLLISEIKSLFDLQTFSFIFVIFMLLFMAGAEHWQEKKLESVKINI